MPPSFIILYEDNHCLAVNKPAPLLTQGVGPDIVTLESLVKDYLRQKYGKTGRVYLGIPHRLDRPVSGVVLFARQTKSAQRLAEQFQRRQVIKVYWAAVEGVVAVVVKKKDSALSEADILNPLKKRLANYKLPKRVIFVTELPKSDRGKVLRDKLKDDWVKRMSDSA